MLQEGEEVEWACNGNQSFSDPLVSFKVHTASSGKPKNLLRIVYVANEKLLTALRCCRHASEAAYYCPRFAFCM